MELKLSVHIKWNVIAETVILRELEQLSWNYYDFMTKQKNPNKQIPTNWNIFIYL